LPFLEDAAHVTGSTFSPDGRFVAYASRPPGDDRRDVFVRPFPPAEGVWQVSSDGGDRPRWSRAGDRIFYARGEDLMEVEVRTRPTLSLGSPRLRLAGAASRLRLDQGYDVSPDGRSFAAIREVPDPEGHLPSLIVVENWSAEVRK
jgi:Tol biopolymer transport system component